MKGPILQEVDVAGREEAGISRDDVVGDCLLAAVAAAVFAQQMSTNLTLDHQEVLHTTWVVVGVR